MAEISVIVPVYNVEKYLPQCVDSILSQTFSDFELILVDDGSPDNCGAMCDDYARHDERICVIHQKNGGLSAARNTGVQAARGRYITFVDSDDYIARDFCRATHHMLEKTDCDFAACAALKVQDGEAFPPEEEWDGSFTVMSNAAYLEKQIDSGFSACGKLYRREIFREHSFLVGRIHEDIIFCSDLAKGLHSGVCNTDQKLYRYRQNDAGIMANSKKRCSPDRVFAGAYLYGVAKESFPDLKGRALAYAVKYPWSFVDGIYVRRTFWENRPFLERLRSFLRESREEIASCGEMEPIVRHRMSLFADSPVLYGVNAYSRLARVYLYHIVGKDAYRDGHGI